MGRAGRVLSLSGTDGVTSQAHVLGGGRNRVYHLQPTWCPRSPGLGPGQARVPQGRGQGPQGRGGRKGAGDLWKPAENPSSLPGKGVKCAGGDAGWKRDFTSPMCSLAGSISAHSLILPLPCRSPARILTRPSLPTITSAVPAFLGKVGVEGEAVGPRPHPA